MLTAFGLASLMRGAFEPAILTLRIAGAGYLIYLGLHALVTARRCDQTATTAPETRSRGRSSTALRRGMISDLANPKMVVFFHSLLPQFTGGHASFATMVALGLASPR